MAVTVLGQAKELTGDKAKSVAKLYLAKHPQLEGFLTSPTCALVSTRRNRMLEDLAARIRTTPGLAACLKSKNFKDCDPEFIEARDLFLDQYGDTAWGDSRLSRYSASGKQP